MYVKEILMPRLGVNDEYVTIGQWLIKSGEFVNKGQEIASLETSKETDNLIVESDGFVFIEIEAGEDVKVGNKIAVLTDSPKYKSDIPTNSSTINSKITAKAQAFIEKHNLDISSLAHLPLIRTKDVLMLLDSVSVIEPSKSNQVIIVGGGGLSKMCIDLINLNKSYGIYGITDYSIPVGTNILGVPVLGNDEILESLYKEGYLTAVNAIGSISIDNMSKNFSLRKNIYERIKSYGFFMPVLIHPSARIAISARIGEGSLIMENAVIGCDAIIGNDCIINTGAIISHDCRIGHHSRISPGAILAGNITIGENSLIGMGTTIYLGVKIGKNVVIANGKNIMNDIPDNSVIK